jgi:meso-butanediol dehydrogenase/(S,S)-butanediol dehydrogenase/diacetyl reductase
MNSMLNTRIAIVTGAAQGIGRGIAERLARQGAAVVLADVQAEAAQRAAQELSAAGARVAAHALDLADPAQILGLIDAAVAAFGRLDILVNCAGIMQSKPMLDLTAADVDRMYAINQRGVLLALQAAARQMIAQIPVDVRTAGRAERSHGKIVNIASIAAYSPRPMALHYGMTKAAVISITRSAAAALAPYNINVNAVCPGATPTAMWAEMAELQGAARGLSAEDFTRQMADSVPLKRFGSVEDAAGAVAYLAGPDSDYVTGQALHVDGGMVMD